MIIIINFNFETSINCIIRLSFLTHHGALNCFENRGPYSIFTHERHWDWECRTFRITVIYFHWYQIIFHFVGCRIIYKNNSCPANQKLSSHSSFFWIEFLSDFWHFCFNPYKARSRFLIKKMREHQYQIILPLYSAPLTIWSWFCQCTRNSSATLETILPATEMVETRHQLSTKMSFALVSVSLLRSQNK